MTEKEFLSAVRAGKSGGYLFFGEEGFLKSRYLQMAKKAVCTDSTLDSFNLSRITADTYSPEAVANAITSMPLMADRKLVELHGIKYSSLKQEELNNLLSSLELLSSNPQTVFIAFTTPYELDTGILPKRPTKTYTELTKYLEPIMFARPSEADLKKWILKHFASEKITADISTADMIITRAGHDMLTLENEIEKLCIYLHTQYKTVPDIEDIEAAVCSNTEADDFAFSNALREKNTDKVFELLDMMKREKVEEIVILSTVGRFFSELFDIKLLYEDRYSQLEIARKLKMNDYRAKLALEASRHYTMKQLKRAVEICRNADLKLKSTPVIKYVITDRVVAELMSL